MNARKGRVDRKRKTHDQSQCPDCGMWIRIVKTEPNIADLERMGSQMTRTLRKPKNAQPRVRAHVADVIARCEKVVTEAAKSSDSWVHGARCAFVDASAWLREFPEGDEQHG